MADSSHHGAFKDHYRYRYITQLCRDFHKHHTNSEDLLWYALRNRKLGGFKFYRQHPFGRFVMDFYCHEARLVVEIDGGIHNKKDVKDYDGLRQGIIEEYGVRFFRCTTADVEAAQAHPLIPFLRRKGDSGNSQKGESSKRKNSNA